GAVGDVANPERTLVAGERVLTPQDAVAEIDPRIIAVAVGIDPLRIGSPPIRGAHGAATPVGTGDALVTRHAGREIAVARIAGVQPLVADRVAGTQKGVDFGFDLCLALNDGTGGNIALVGKVVLLDIG